MRIHYLQHVFFEGPARIAGWVRRRDHTLAATKLCQDEPLLDGTLDCMAARVAR